MDTYEHACCHHDIIEIIFNSLPNNILDITKLKAFADDKINVARMMISVFERVEHTVEKQDNAGYQHFLLFPQCFQKVFSLVVEW